MPIFIFFMPVIFAPFVKKIIEYAESIARLYGHQEILPAHLVWALLKHHTNSYITAYIETKTHLVTLKQHLLQFLEQMESKVGEPVLSAVVEFILKDAYTEAKDFQSEIILPEYIFLATLKHQTFENLSYVEAKDFIQTKTDKLLHQHTEINWTKQNALLQLLKSLDDLYRVGKITLKPYLHQAYNQAREEIRGFALLVEEAGKANKITIELVESTRQTLAIEQTLRFLAHRKYPLEEAFLYLYDTQEWIKIVVAPKEIFIAQENHAYSDVLQVGLANL